MSGPARTVAASAGEYAQALAPHLEHEGYRCDDPRARLMGKGCRTCGVEVVIAIADFQRNGDLPAYEAVMKPLQKGKK